MKVGGERGRRKKRRNEREKTKEGRGKCNRRLRIKDNANFDSLLNKGPGPHWGKLLGGRRSRGGQWSILSEVGPTFLFLGQLSS